MQLGKQIMTAFVAVLTVVATGCVREGSEERVHSTNVQRPRVVLRSPKADVTFPWNAEIRIVADVRDLPNAIVEFGAEDTTITRDATPPYETTFRPRGHGPVVITAQVRDAGGSVVAGDAVTVTVLNPSPVSSTQELTGRDISMGMLGPEPLVDLKSPANGQIVQPEVGVRFVAETAGLKAPLARVEFVADGVVVRQEPVSGDKATGDVYLKPIEYVWPNPSPGRHVVMARAIDAEGRVGMSKTVTVIVEKAR